MKYFPGKDEVQPKWNVFFEMRADLAWDLIHHFGSVAGDTKGEDTVGRARIQLQTPEELVARCFAIADVFVATAESRGDLQVDERTTEEKATQQGKILALRADAEWRQDKSPVK